MTENLETGKVRGEDGVEEQSVESLDRADTIELEEATTEPEAVVERSGDFIEAESIEVAVVEAVEFNAPPTEEIESPLEGWSTSGDADDRPTEEIANEVDGWSTSGDADDRPTEEVAAVVGATAPPTEEVAEAERISGDADDRPTEEVAVAKQGWSTSGDADDRPTVEVAVAKQGWGTSGDADDRPTEELTAVSKELLIRAFKDDEFFDVLMVDTGSALTEYGLTGEDLPDLSDPTHPATIAFVTEVENEVLEVIGELDMSDYADELQERDSDREIRMIMLNQMLNKKGNAVSQLTNMIKQAHNTDQSIIKNLK